MAKKAPEEIDSPIEGYTKIWEGKVVLSRITTRPELQVRPEGVDDKTVREYCKAIEDPLDDLPAMAVFTTATEFNDKCALVMADGHHTVTAYKQMNRQTGPVKVFHGDEHDALRYALDYTGRHGKPLTPKGREFAIRLALADPELKKLSVRRLAELVHCSKSLVHNIKNPPAPKQHKAKPDQEPVTTPAPAIPELSNVGQHERYEPGPLPAAATSEGPAAQPPTVRERQESTLPTKNERLAQFTEWFREGHITRNDVANVLSTEGITCVSYRSDLPKSKKSLMIRHGSEILIDAEVTVEEELPAMIVVSVEDPRLVEYSFEEDIFAQTA